MSPGPPLLMMLKRLLVWFRRWFLDGWITTGPQLWTTPGETRVFTRCIGCGRIYPHWLASMKAEEVKRRGYIGCRCGGIRIQPVMIPGWQATWWMLVRGWFIRRLLFRERLWDPRMPLLYEDLK